MSDESRKAFEAWKKKTLGDLDHFPSCLFKTAPFGSCDCGDRHAFEAGVSARDAEVAALESRIEYLSALIDQERLETGILIVDLKNRTNWLEALKMPGEQR